MTKQQRIDRLLPNGLPRYVRIYDDAESGDRYTAVFTGNYAGRKGCDYIGMSGAPFHPQGIGQHGWNQDVIDRPTYSHLGKRIKFLDLPEDCQILVLRDYLLTWGLATEDDYHAKAAKMVRDRIAATAAVPV